MTLHSLLRATCAVSGLATGFTIAAGAAFAEEPDTQDEIVVTASPLARSVQETIIGTNVIDEDELGRRLENTLGETLRREPGISSTYFGPGASRPIIRGLGGDRIRVLDAGIGSIDASSASPDHAVSVEPATAERIEIVRGSGTLLYGSSAAGGVVNVFSGRIPDSVPENGFSGALRIGGSTVDNGVEAAGGFDLSLGRVGAADLVFHGEGFYREADDYDIPGFAESARLREMEEADGSATEEDHDEDGEAFGTLENSAFETKGGSAGLSLIFANGFIGVSATALDTNYGVPGGHGHEHEGEEDEEEEGEEEGGVTIDLKQRRLDLRGGYEADFGPFRQANLRIGLADYEHTEIEPNGEVGTVFANEGWEGRLELLTQKASILNGSLEGAIGAQYRKRDFSAIGEEAFVPPTTTDQLGLFALSEYAVGRLKVDLGGRFEDTNHEVTETGLTRQFQTFSVSSGVGFAVNDNMYLGVTGFRTERAPSTEELFSNGPHLATNAFEVGNPDLEVETARGVEAAFRLKGPRFSFLLNGFYTSYRDFIFETPTGAEEDELPVFEFVAADATFRGLEAQGEVELFEMGGFDFHADASVDLVRATAETGGNENLPRIPPVSALFGVEASSPQFDVRAELDLAASQNNTASFELPTDGFEVVNLFFTYRPLGEAKGPQIQLSVQNLTDQDVRYHTSFLKDLAPLPGRNFRVAVTGQF